ncbi:Uncharacterized protein OBRU01_22904 [Operophtera brumata]|uniref:Lipid droplet-associated hydrolase n=1 Tax=Operophtera brumata TaxID=104452 RepID=A0A0L7KPW8_OPEBR|nr:Uncharacterized protein OBRU01_22904 [Operophtera brumata]
MLELAALRHDGWLDGKDPAAGQAGHEEVPDQRSNELKGQEQLFNLEGQIQHKLDFISNHIDKDNFLKNMLISIYLKWNSFPFSFSESILKLCRPHVVEKVLFLCYEEIDKVQRLNIEVLEIVKGCTNVLYSPRDAWVPVQFMDELRQFEPHLKMKEVDAEHAFVLNSSAEIAEMVSDFIKEKM